MIGAMERAEDKARECRARLDTGIDLEKTLAECAPLKDELAADGEKLDNLREDFHYLRSGLALRAFGESVRHPPSGGEWNAPNKGMIQELNDFPHRLKAAKLQSYQESDLLGASFAEARKIIAARTRRNWYLGAAGGALAALATGLGMLGWGRRRMPPLALPRGTHAHPKITLGQNYRVDRELGRGGMGLVYEATDLSLNRKVAIKLMNVEPELEPLGKEMFLKEAQLVAGLRHPNIVRIFDILEEQGRIFLIFEHVEGKTLNELAAARRRMPFDWVKATLQQVCAALDYAHDRNVIHRDLKPSNIMAAADGTAKIMDFGIARRVENPVTRTRSWGTPPYMAPEQELGTVSREVDLYALGVCLYELTTGRRPFPGPDFLGQKQRMEYSKERLSVGLKPVIGKALAADPAARYRSGAEFAAALLKI